MGHEAEVLVDWMGQPADYVYMYFIYIYIIIYIYILSEGVSPLQPRPLLLLIILFCPVAST